MRGRFAVLVALTMVLGACSDRAPVPTGGTPTSVTATSSRTSRNTTTTTTTLSTTTTSTAVPDPDDPPEGGAFNPETAANCEDLADALIEIAQLLLDDVGSRSDDEFELDGELIVERWESELESRGYLEVDAVSEALGCGELAVLVLMCDRLGRLEPRGEARNSMVLDLAGPCPASFDEGALSEIGLVGTVALPRSLSFPTQIGVGLGAVWVLDGGTSSLLKIDPEASRVVASSTARGAFNLGVGPDGVWFTNIDGNTVTHVNATAKSIGTIDVGVSPMGVGFGAGSMWVANNDDATVSRIDPMRHEVVATIPVGTVGLADVVYAGGVIWVADFSENTIYRIDPATNEVIGDPIAVGDAPVRMDASDDSIWVANLDDGSVSRIDLESADVVFHDCDRV